MRQEMTHSRRLAARFGLLSEEKRAGLIAFIVAGDPNYDLSATILSRLPEAGADLIELGMPFSDPMADGPVIQEGSQRALKAGMTLEKTLSMVADFRALDSQTPLILMGYYNPVHAYGVEAFTKKAAQSGVDGVILVDLPPEELTEFQAQATRFGLDCIRLSAPTSDLTRLSVILAKASGFIYHVSVRGVTGTKRASEEEIAGDLGRLRSRTGLPIAIGFGISQPEHVAVASRLADAVVVGSALVACIGQAPLEQACERVVSRVAVLAKAIRKAGREKTEP